jgi:hypothetical protein
MCLSTANAARAGLRLWFTSVELSIGNFSLACGLQDGIYSCPTPTLAGGWLEEFSSAVVWAPSPCSQCRAISFIVRCILQILLPLLEADFIKKKKAMFASCRHKFFLPLLGSPLGQTKPTTLARASVTAGMQRRSWWRRRPSRWCIS